MRTKHRSGRAAGRWLVAATLSLGVIAAACSKKDDNSSDTQASETTAAGAATTAAGATTSAGGGTATTAGGGTATTAAGSTATTAATSTTAAGPKEKPVTGGSITVSGEAEVANPWTPEKMNCDSYCQQRARTFYDPLVALGTDNKVHGVLAESVTPNSDNTQFTVKLRQGINFTDGTPFNADAAIRNLQDAGHRPVDRRCIGRRGEEPGQVVEDREGRRLHLHDLHR